MLVVQLYFCDRTSILGYEFEIPRRRGNLQWCKADRKH